MSRGPGKIERAIEAAFAAEPENALTVEDLCERVYPGLNRVEKKHRVSVLKAVRTLWARPSPHWYGCAGSDAVGGGLVFFNRLSLTSYAVGRVKALSHHRTDDKRVLPHWRADEDKVRAMLESGGKWHNALLPGGGWRDHVDAWKAERAGDTETAKRIWEKNDRDLRRLMGRPTV